MEMEKDTRPIILIVEDDESLNKFYKTSLERSGDKEFQILIAEDKETAIDLFKKNKENIVVITIGGEIPPMKTKESNTVELVTRFCSQGFPKDRLIAASTILQEVLISAGCHHRCDEKHLLPKQILALLQN